MNIIKIDRVRMRRMASDWGRHGYHPVEGGTGARQPRFISMERGPEKALQMRTLAGRLRGQAAETSLEIFQAKFLATAAELEKAALDAENRARFSLVPGRENDPGNRH
jgi:hypothetical protein